MSLVFAYGSNLSRAQMLSRCPSARAVAKAVLPDFTLAFAGYSLRWRGPVATFVRRPKGKLHGLVYRIDPIDLFRLDCFEGAPKTYEHTIVEVTSLETSHKVRALAYKLAKTDGLGELPSMDYLCTIDRAYRELGFDRNPLFTAAFRPHGLTLGRFCHR